MKKIEAITLEDAYKKASDIFGCSITELKIEVVQVPNSGFLGLFKKSAIIVATKNISQTLEPEAMKESAEATEQQEVKEELPSSTLLDETIMPDSFVATQDDDEASGNALDYTADYDDASDEKELQKEEKSALSSVISEVEREINQLFEKSCYSIDKIEVSAYDEETLLVEFKGDDVALLIGKEGYRYKALSYMLFNWLNLKYGLQLRLEIAEFLKNQEESMHRYLVSVCETVERDGRAQTKILDGVLLQIALKELRERYPHKYVAIRTTKDGMKFIIINDYNR